MKETAGPATTTRFWALSPPHRRVPHISLVFREMWDTAALALKPVAVLQLRTGAPCSHQRTWAENDGRSPTTAFRSGPTRFSLGPEESWAFGPPRVMKNGSCSATTLPGSTALPFVVSTGAYPDFLLHDAATTTYAVFLKKTAYVLINATNLDRKSGGAEWRDLRFSGHFLEVFFDRAKRRRRTAVSFPGYPHTLLSRDGSLSIGLRLFPAGSTPEAAILSGLHSGGCAMANVT